MSAEPPARIDGRTARRLATRARIVEATLALHTSVGPARTSISAIAERAGVQRHTVYAHFADDEELFRECSGLWAARNPFPAASRWSGVADPAARVRTALEEVYAYWEATATDLAAIVDGHELVPAMAEPMRRWEATLDGAAAALVRGRGLRGTALRRARALARVALDLATWRTLTGPGGLSRPAAAGLMAEALENTVASGRRA